MKKFKTIMIAAALMAVSTMSHASEMVNGVYQWQFLSGEPWPSGYNQSTGKPDNLTWAYTEYPSGFFDRISNALPEGYVNEAYLTGDNGSNIHLNEDAEVFITFIHEGAGYKNVFSYFTYDRNNPPKSREEVKPIVVFPNLSYPHMARGHRVSLGIHPAGTSIGFMVAANGYWWWTGVKDHPTPYYYSLSDLNQEPESLKQHTVLLYDPDVSEVVIGFEDLPRSWGDNDFNDAVFSVKTTPETAIDSESLFKIPESDDSDADGVSDTDDDFPNDYNRAYSTYYPSETGYTTLAMEDNWPKKGDYDMNDLVIRERYQLIYNANYDITGMRLTGYIDARGASKHNGFGVRLMGVSPDILEYGTITINGTTYNKSAENWQTDLVIKMWSDTHTFTFTGEAGKCSHFNTVMSCGSYDPIPFELDLSFTPQLTSLPHADLDFFMFKSNRRDHEIHFAGYPPTDFGAKWRFGRGDDDSNSDENRYYVTEDGQSWGIKLTDDWDYPREYIDVIWAYPDYEVWVESNGTEKQDWYQSTFRSKTHVYK